MCDNFYNGVWLPSTEHPSLQQHIITPPTPKEAMFEARRILPSHVLSPEWLDHRISIMYSLLEAKSDQCPVFRDAVSCHGQFAEDPCNCFWGRGANFHDKNQLGLCLGRLRRHCIPHLMIIGDSHLHSMPHIVHNTSPVRQCTSSYMEYSHCYIGNTFVSTTIVCNPGIITPSLVNLVDKFPFLVNQASRVFTSVGSNDISSELSPATIQIHTKMLPKLIYDLNRQAKIFGMCVSKTR